MIVNYPSFNINKYSREIAMIIDDYTKTYNLSVEEFNKNRAADVPKKQRLLGTHRQTIWFLLRAVRDQIGADNKELRDVKLMAVDSTKPYSLYINRGIYHKREGKCGRTFYGHIIRLLEAGFIVKKSHHSHRYSFELEINPDFLLLTDLDTDQTWRNGKMWLSEGEKEKVAVYTLPLNQDHNKEIINVENSCLIFHEQNIQDHEQNEITHTQRIDKVSEIQGIIRDIAAKSRPSTGAGDPAEKPSQELARERLDHYKLVSARIILAYAIQQLWPDEILWRNGKEVHKISPGEQENATQLIYQHMFKKMPHQQLDGARKWLSETIEWAKLCIDRSRKLLDKKNYQNWFVHPSRYFAPDYDKGIYKTSNYIKTYQNEEVLKRNAIKKRRLMYECVEKFKGLPTSPNYHRLKNLLENSAPELINEFLMLINDHSTLPDQDASITKPAKKQQHG